jgi:protein-disulfide isomerase
VQRWLQASRVFVFFEGGSMRRTLTAVVLSLAALTLALSSAFASGPPSRTPDAKAVPLLGTAKVTLLQGIQQVQAKYGRVIEAKFELDDSGALSLSVYGAKGYDVFKEVSGSPTSSPWKSSPEVIKAREDVVNSTFDLTILQQSKIGLATAVRRALAQQPGVAYWAIPTLKGSQPEIGVYVRASDGKSHHILIPVS